MNEMEYTERLEERLILDNGKYKGYNFWIISLGTHPCAYVELPKEHPYYGKIDEEAYELPIDVHGGITYGDFGLRGVVDSSKFLLGWDYAHFDDYTVMFFNVLDYKTLKKWTTKEILYEVKNVINQLIEKGINGKQSSSWVVFQQDKRL